MSGHLRNAASIAKLALQAFHYSGNPMRPPPMIAEFVVSIPYTTIFIGFFCRMLCFCSLCLHVFYYMHKKSTVNNRERFIQRMKLAQSGSRHM